MVGLAVSFSGYVSYRRTPPLVSYRQSHALPTSGAGCQCCHITACAMRGATGRSKETYYGIPRI